MIPQEWVLIKCFQGTEMNQALSTAQLWLTAYLDEFSPAIDHFLLLLVE